MKSLLQFSAVVFMATIALVSGLFLNRFSTLYRIDVENRVCAETEYLDISPDGKNWTCSKI